MGCRFAWILTSQVRRRPLLLLACVGYPQFLWRPDVTHTDDKGCNDDDHERRYVGQHRQESTVDVGAPRLKLKLHSLDAPEQERSDESVEGIPHGKDDESNGNPSLAGGDAIEPVRVDAARDVRSSRTRKRSSQDGPEVARAHDVDAHGVCSLRVFANSPQVDPHLRLEQQEPEYGYQDVASINDQVLAEENQADDWDL